MESVLATEVLFSLLVLFSISFFCLRYSDKMLAKILFLGFLVRAGLAYLQRFVVSLPDSTADAVRFERNAWQAAEAWQSGVEAAVKLKGSRYYTRLIAWFYAFLGRVPLVVQFINVLLGTFLIFIVYKTALVLFEEKRAARIAALITAFFPTLCLYSAITMREAIVVFFLALSFCFFAYWLKARGLRFILFSLIVIFVSSIYHGGVVFVGGAYLLIFSFYSPQKKSWKIFSRQLIIGIILTIIYSSLFFGFFRSKIPNVFLIVHERITYIVSDFYREEAGDTGYREEAGDLIETARESSPGITFILERVSSARVKGRAAYLQSMHANNFFDLVWQTPVRIIYFYLKPFPWNIENLADFGGFVDLFFWFLLFIFSFKSLRLVKNEDKALFLTFLLIFVIFSATFAWGTSNHGTALRHRQKIVFLLIVGASYFLAKINWKKSLLGYRKQKKL